MLTFSVWVGDALLVSVTYMIWLCVFTVWLENTSGFGVAVTSDAGMVAFIVTVMGV